MRDYSQELADRTAWIRRLVEKTGVRGIAYNNSGGKDAALVGILCKKACGDTVGLILPCSSRQNYNEDKEDAYAVAEQFDIAQRVFDLTDIRAKFLDMLSPDVTLNDMALVNIAPRLRMVTLYAVANAENRLAAGTGNRSETHMGYFTKWGDGAYDFNPIADLTVTEVYEFLRYLGAPERIITKPPSAGLYDGQTDEGDMGVTYASIDRFILTGETDARDGAIIARYHGRSEHKRRMSPKYPEEI